MDALEFIRERNKMCKSFGDSHSCMKCPAYREGNRCIAILWKEEIVPIVERWSEKNTRKTRQSVFMEHYPNVNVDNQGIPFIYPCDVDKTIRRKDGPCYKGCEECRAEFWTQKVK